MFFTTRGAWVGGWMAPNVEQRPTAQIVVRQISAYIVFTFTLLEIFDALKKMPGGKDPGRRKFFFGRWVFDNDGPNVVPFEMFFLKVCTIFFWVNERFTICCQIFQMYRQTKGRPFGDSMMLWASNYDHRCQQTLDRDPGQIHGLTSRQSSCRVIWIHCPILERWKNGYDLTMHLWWFVEKQRLWKKMLQTSLPDQSFFHTCMAFAYKEYRWGAPLSKRSVLMEWSSRRSLLRQSDYDI